MAKRKKSRKVGVIGTPSIPKAARKPKTTSGKPKKKTGNATGSRHSAVEISSGGLQQKAKSDPRIGSKKPVPLIVEPKKDKAVKQPFFTPAQELAALESDPELVSLLDKLDRGIRLNATQQGYVDNKIARHKALCELLGVQIEESSEEGAEVEKDLFEQFDTIDIEQFKDE